MDTLRLRAAVRRSQPNIQRSSAATIQKPTAIPISRSTWRTECQWSPRTMRTDAPLRRTPLHYQNEQEPFIEKSDQMKAHAVRIGRRVQLMGKNLMPDRPTAYRGEHQNRVDWASDLGIAV